jgi:hypothetical protein
MYTTTASSIRLFQLPNTLAGDAAVTIIVQCLITWMAELALVNSDLRRGNVAPTDFVPQPPESRPLLRWFMFLGRAAESAEPGSWHHWAFFLVAQLLRAFLVAVVSFCLLWGPSVGILTAVGARSGSDWVFGKKWAPQIFKLLLGAVLGLLTTPMFAVFWMIRSGWALTTDEARAGGS